MSTTVIAALEAEDVALGASIAQAEDQQRALLQQIEDSDAAACAVEQNALDVLELANRVREETKRMGRFIAEIPSKAQMEKLLSDVGTLRKKKGQLKTHRADIEKQLANARRARDVVRRQYARHLDAMSAQTEVLIGKVSTQPWGYWGGEKKVPAQAHVVALSEMCVEREQAWRDAIHAVNQSTDANEAASALVTTAEQSSETDLSAVLEEHAVWKEQLGESYDQERRRLVAHYKELATLNREYAFHIYRGTCYKAGTKPTRREIDLQRTRDALVEEVHTMSADFEKVRDELVQLQSQHEAYNGEVAAVMAAFNGKRDVLGAQLADVDGFVKALKEERMEWDTLKRDLDSAGSRRR
jgi:hypothetical protein